MRILIVEDEAIAARRLRKMVEALEPASQIEAVLDSVASSVEWLKTNSAPDLLLLDIELADGQSFEIFAQLEVSCPVIFTTAYDEHVLKAFRLNSVDYLLKPIQEKELQRSLLKFRNMKKVFAGQDPHLVNLETLLQEINEQRTPAADLYRDRILVKQGHRMFSVICQEVAYFFTKEKVTFLRTKDDRHYQVDFTLEELERSLNPKDFFRANRQFIVNFAAVAKVSQELNAKLKISLHPDPEEEIMISREKAMEFRAWLGE
ncbi:LytR/AlgR family response regulator transcription factor [Rufibacter hautae]|uniref:Response regulator transcription factor n=1 Tax=Rufibacter hautae TaxID=2595005 RepID=A0A5B6TQV1_9BACT|nr:LytTR family DNA-binding domain-containing protein [Rufibacter hautae]KAA3438803.1 response regulator transcription factor [Rufibacter hautae]